MKYLVLILLVIFVLPIQAQYNRLGRSADPQGEYVKVTPQSGMGLEAIFVFENLSQAKFSYQTDKNSIVNFFTYSSSLTDKVSYPSNLVMNDQNGGYTLSGLKDAEAIVVEDNGLLLCFWILDYGLYKPSISSIISVDTEDCKSLKLQLGVDYKSMFYRGVSGFSVEIERVFELSYNRQIWNENSFITEKETEQLINPSSDFILNQSPLMNTSFTLSGDQFAAKFGKIETFTSDVIDVNTVEGHIIAEQKNNKTGIYETKDNLGGSAPIDINFYGKGNESTYFYTWYIYNVETPDSPIARYSDQDISYTFSQYGTYKVYLEVANQQSSCIDTMSVDVQVADSYLRTPNFMTPKDPNGKNKTFKVVAKSIVKYECTIFNRWGNKLFHTTDINQAWDGKYRGKYVEPGPYFYSIIALGADGIVYKKGGDINVL